MDFKVEILLMVILYPNKNQGWCVCVFIFLPKSGKNIRNMFLLWVMLGQDTVENNIPKLVILLTPVEPVMVLLP
jgi:hypothetical protein